MFLVTNPEVEDLNLKVYDERSKSVLGLLRLNLGDLLLRNGMEYLNQPFKLNTQVNTSESVVILSLQLFVTKKVLGRRKISRGVSENDTVSVVSFGDNDSDPVIHYSRVSAISGLSTDQLEPGHSGHSGHQLEESVTLHEDAGD